MKIKHHIPQEEYGFTEIEYEVDDDIQMDEILSEYPKKKEEIENPIEGLSDIDFGKLRNKYEETEKMTGEMQNLWEQCNKEQRTRIADITKLIRKRNEN